MVCRRGKGRGTGLQKAEGLDAGTVLQKALRVHQLVFAEVVRHLKELANLEPGTFDDGELRGEQQRGRQVGLMVELLASFQERAPKDQVVESPVGEVKAFAEGTAEPRGDPPDLEGCRGPL